MTVHHSTQTDWNRHSLVLIIIDTSLLYSYIANLVTVLVDSRISASLARQVLNGSTHLQFLETSREHLNQLGHGRPRLPTFRPRL